MGTEGQKMSKIVDTKYDSSEGSSFSELDTVKTSCDSSLYSTEESSLWNNENSGYTVVDTSNKNEATTFKVLESDLLPVTLLDEIENDEQCLFQFGTIFRNPKDGILSSFEKCK